PSMLITLLGPLIQRFASNAPAIIDEALATVDATQRIETDQASIPSRIASFCPGCPHRDTASLCLEIKRRLRNASYMRDKGRDPVDLMFHGDTGCYTMLIFPPNTDLMHDCSGMGLGGGTASGVDPFLTNKEVVFMGDSTFYHSGMIAISQAVNLNQDITFVILDNSTTAMTGHQPQPGNAFDLLGNPTPEQNIEDIVRGIGGELGVDVVRANPERRNEYRELLEETFLADGVKVIIADKECGITMNRRRKRSEREIRKEKGFLPKKTHMNINQDICRFCLACSEMTGCPGLRHVETDYGRKMDTDASWCVNDGCCERIGACDAFEQVTVLRNNPPKSKVPELGLDDIPDPRQRQGREVWQAVLTGVGGMGIGLATSILVRAGHNEGYEVEFLDKKGLAIRNGGVVSQVLFNLTHQPLTPIISYGKADLLLGVDVLEAARLLQPAHRFRVIGKDSTAAVINTDKIATIGGLMGREDYDPDQLVELIQAHTRSEEFLARNISRICESYLGSKLYANIMMMGYAFQQGLIPVSMDSMARAIQDSIRVDFEKNLYAFNMGRKLVVEPDLFQGPPSRDTWRDMLEDRVRWIIRRFGKPRKIGDRLNAIANDACEHMAELDEQALRQFVVHLYDCVRWGRISYAQHYADLVRKTYDRDRGEYGFAATTTVIRHLAGAMLIKDTIYKAELATGPEKIARDRRKYNVNPQNGDRMIYKFLFHRKMKLFGKRWNATVPVGSKLLRWLRSQRWLRGWITNKYNLRYRDSYIDLVNAFDYDSAEAYQTILKSLSRSSCMHCVTPTCGDVGCPLHNDIPVWMAHAADGDYKAAIERLHATNNFPEFTAAICPAPCEESCKRARRNMPVPIQTTEQEIVAHAFSGGYITPQKPSAVREQTIAVVGSGPAGLAAAQQLTRAGYRVTVFEKDDQPGGLLRYGIPEHRLGSDIIDRRIKQLQAEGTQFALNTAIGQTVSGKTLRADFDAICLAVGTPAPRDLNLPGRDKQGIVYATDFLRRQHDLTIGQGKIARGSAPAAGKHVVVIGGGLTGEDCAEAALEQGAKSVTILEIRPEAPTVGNLPETVDMKTCTRTVAFEGQGDSISAIRIVGVKYIPSATGPVAQDVSDTEATLPADLAILAAGFLPAIDAGLAEQLDLACDGSGRLLVNEQFATTTDGIFAAGDVVTSAAYVATAIHSGRKCAKRIHQYIQTHIDA
ncbi:MAG: FAD-dependent oxidoreductase, partial [Phycisphaerales bacterium]|nr:FAD-dependent oxidoreductase [Phycisphaerales bacterium]